MPKKISVPRRGVTPSKRSDDDVATSAQSKNKKPRSVNDVDSSANLHYESDSGSSYSNTSIYQEEQSVNGKKTSVGTSDTNSKAFASILQKVQKEIAVLRDDVKQMKAAHSNNAFSSQSTLDSSCASVTTLLTNTKMTEYGIFIRERMFKSVKFLDTTMLESKRRQLSELWLKELNISNEHIKNEDIIKALISKGREYLTQHRGHVTREIRKKVASKFFFF